MSTFQKGPPKKPPPEHFTEAQKHDYNTKKIQLASKSSILTKLLLDSIGGNSVSFLILAVRDEKQYFSGTPHIFQKTNCKQSSPDRVRQFDCNLFRPNSEIKTSLEFGQKCKNVVNKPKETQDAANLQARLKAMEQVREAQRSQKLHQNDPIRYNPADHFKLKPYHGSFCRSVISFGRSGTSFSRNLKHRMEAVVSRWPESKNT